MDCFAVAGDRTPARLAAGARLRQLRQDRLLRAVDAAAAINASEAKVSRMERGLVPFKPSDVVSLLELYGVTASYQVDAVMSLACAQRAAGWWDIPELPLPLSAYFWLEQHADLIRTYQSQFVPPLLQTEDYARAAITASQAPLPGSNVVQLGLETLMRRQQALVREGGPLLWVVIEESVLMRCIAGRQAQIDQMDHLISMSKERHITVQVARFDSSYIPQSAPFTIFRYPNQDLAACLHQFSDYVVMDRQSEVDPYYDAFSRVIVAATQPDRTMEALLQIRDKLQSVA